MQDLQQGIELASRYTLLRKLGAGATAETWLAKDRLTRASVALKILTSDRVTAADFHQEWQSAIRLMHAHIVRVFEYGDDSNVNIVESGSPQLTFTRAPAEAVSPALVTRAKRKLKTGSGGGKKKFGSAGSTTLLATVP